MKTIYKPWGSDPAQNPFGYPAAYPRESTQISDVDPVPEGWIEITRADYDVLIAQHYPAVQAINTAMESVPSEVERWKLRAALKIAGYFDQIETVISNIPEPSRTRIREQWGGKEMVARTHPTIVQIGTSIGLTSEQIDQIFRTAAAMN